MARKKVNNDDKSYYNFKIGTLEETQRALQRLMNATANEAFSLQQIRLMKDIVETRLRLFKIEELEAKVQLLEELLDYKEQE